MTSKRSLARQLVLLVALALLGGYLTFDQWSPMAYMQWEMYKNPPLPGENRVGNLKLVQKSDTVWTASFDYYFVGYPQFAMTIISAKARVEDGKNSYTLPLRYTLPAERGQHTVSFDLQTPGYGGNYRAWADSVTATLGFVEAPAASATLAQRFEWPDAGTIAARPENVVKRAIALIDTEDGRSLEEARVMLQALVARAPNFDPAYVELARIAMKTNWSPEGLRQAEMLIQSALQIQPESTDAKILMAYVYAHQKRYGEAEALNKEVTQKGSTNLWLGANWGELQQLQGRDEEAIAKYREVLQHPPTHDTNDRAREWTYNTLVRMLWSRKDWDGIDVLYRQQVKDYPDNTCNAAHYAQFLLRQRSDADAAIAVLRAAPDGGCGERLGREVMGLAHYVKWSADTEPQRADALRQARVFLPAGPYMFYRLAGDDTTAAVARKLMAAGDDVNMQDAEHQDALAYALRNRDHAAAKRLLRLGARTDSLVGDEKVPVALLPVLMQDIEGVALMRSVGVDYTRLRFQGVSPADLARRMDNLQLLRALDPKGGSL